MAQYLIVDDSRTSRLMLAQAVRTASGGPCEIAEAQDLDEALNAFETHRPEVVFLDMMLDLQTRGESGGSTGLVALQAMLEEQAGARVVLVTALPQDHPDVVSAISMGAFAFLNKPVRTEEVRRVLSAVEAEAGRVGRIR
jgi:DNA-binding NtrC family response regulator